MSILITSLEIYQCDIVEILSTEDEESEFVYITFFMPLIEEFIYTCTLYTELETHVAGIGTTNLNIYDFSKPAEDLLKEICIGVAIAMKENLNETGINKIRETA